MDRSSSEADGRTKILFVCSTNFSRSPLAAAIFNRLAANAGLENRFHAESAGAYPGFEPRAAERRTQELARTKGLDLSAHTVREVGESDFLSYDCFISMDEDSSWLLREVCPDASAFDKIERLTGYLGDLSLKEIADPVNGRIGYEDMFALLERSVQALFSRISKQV